MPHYDELLGMTPRSMPMRDVVPGVSPYTFTTPGTGRVVVTGGTVSLIELGRNGVFIPVGVVTGVVPVSAGDQVRVTYVVAPTITYLQG